VLPASQPAPQTPAEYRAWWEENTDVPYGFCWCGCNKNTTVAARTVLDRKWFEDEPIRYVQGHQARSTTATHDAEICRGYLAGEKPTYIAERFGVDVGTVRRILKRNGIPLADKDDTPRSLSPNEYRRWWNRQRPEIPFGLCWCGCGQKTNLASSTDSTKNWVKGQPMRYLHGHLNASRAAWATDAQKDEIVRRYLDGEGSYALAEEFGVSGANLGKMLDQRGVKRRTLGEAKRVHSCDHAFFDVIDTEEKAYWLGFMAADGNITSDRPVIQLRLASKDREHVVRFASAVRSTHAVADYTDKAGNTYTKLSIASPELTAGLAKHGISPNKTFTLAWPDHLEPELVRNFLRGYFDGDGSWHVWLPQGLAPVLRWEIIGNESFCLGAQGYLVEAIGLRITKLDRPSNAPRIRRLSYSGRNQVSRIYHLMYDGATIYLPRKRDQIEPYARSLSDAEQGPIPLDGEKLRKSRQERGISIEALAAKSGAAAKTISQLETGKRTAYPKTVRKLTDVLGVELSSVLKD
jgi:DNA-binding XRE family transcriptional regulator